MIHQELPFRSPSPPRGPIARALLALLQARRTPPPPVVPVPPDVHVLTVIAGLLVRSDELADRLAAERDRRAALKYGYALGLAAAKGRRR